MDQAYRSNATPLYMYMFSLKTFQAAHQSFLDLTISVGAEIEKVRCHKFIVAMVSDVIQSESVMKDEIIFTNIKKDILQEIIDYCYTQMIGPFVNKSHVSPRPCFSDDFMKIFRLKTSVMASKSFKSES